MIFVMPWIRGFLGALSLAIISSALAQGTPGEPKGAVAYTLPAWFKPSFLDVPEDIAEARARNRHLMLFVHLDGCPYCARMLEENFTRGENHDFMRQHFDVVGLNVRGAQEVVWIDGKSYTEQALARHLKVFGTPTLVFLGQDGKIALQLSGYRDPRALREALEYVHGRHYREKKAQLAPRF